MFKVNYRRHLALAVLLGLIELSSFGCNSGSSAAPAEVISDTSSTDYEIASCRYSAGDGQVAGAFPSAASVRTVLFGKKYDDSLLTPILKASINETVAFIRLAGAEPYGMSSSIHHSKCAPLAGLPAAPSDYLKYWTDVTSDSSEKSWVDGLYVDQGHADMPSATDHGIIGVLQEADRYTLVHEYMHHLFNRQRRADGEKSADTSAALDQADTEFKASRNAYFASKNDKTGLLPESRTVDNYTTYAHDLGVILPALRKLVIEFALEEVTNESILQAKVADGELEFAPLLLDSSNAYIKSSSASALKILKVGDDLVKTLEADFPPAFTAEQILAATTDLQVQVDANEALRKQIDEARTNGVAMMRKKPATSAHLQAKLMAAAVTVLRPQGSNTEAPVVQCAHGRQFDEIAARLSALNPQD